MNSWCLTETLPSSEKHCFTPCGGRDQKEHTFLFFDSLTCQQTDMRCTASCEQLNKEYFTDLRLPLWSSAINLSTAWWLIYLPCRLTPLTWLAGLGLNLQIARVCPYYQLQKRSSSTCQSGKNTTPTNFLSCWQNGGVWLWLCYSSLELCAVRYCSCRYRRALWLRLSLARSALLHL